MIKRHPCLLLIAVLILFGIVGHMDFVDEVRAEYQHKCDGMIDVEGDLVICTKDSTKSVIGELK